MGETNWHTFPCQKSAAKVAVRQGWHWVWRVRLDSYKFRHFWMRFKGYRSLKLAQTSSLNYSWGLTRIALQSSIKLFVIKFTIESNSWLRLIYRHLLVEFVFFLLFSIHFISNNNQFRPKFRKFLIFTQRIEINTGNKYFFNVNEIQTWFVALCLFYLLLFLYVYLTSLIKINNKLSKIVNSLP